MIRRTGCSGDVNPRVELGSASLVAPMASKVISHFSVCVEAEESSHLALWSKFRTGVESAEGRQEHEGGESRHLRAQARAEARSVRVKLGGIWEVDMRGGWGLVGREGKMGAPFRRRVRWSRVREMLKNWAQYVS